MKLKLLLIAFILCFATRGFSQVTANDVPDIVHCNNNIFDLTANIPIALGDQDPQQYSVTFHETEADAQNNMQVLLLPQQYTLWGQSKTIFVRVTKLTGGEYDITEFNVLNYYANAYDMPLYESCVPVAVMETQMGAFYTGPGGTGSILPAGTLITESQVIYHYVQNGPCSDEGIWNIVIGSFPVEYDLPTPLLGCDEDEDGIFTVNLYEKQFEMTGQQEVGIEFYQTEADAQAGINPIPNPENYVVQAVPAVVYALITNIPGCSVLVPVEILAGGCTGNTFSGVVTVDSDHNGCDENDAPAQGVAVYYVNNNDIVTTFTNEDGEYTFTNVPNGSSMVYTAWEINQSTTPEYHQVTFPGTIDTLNFCINVPVPALNVGAYLVPITAAQPGFDAGYALVYYNIGTIPASGSVSVQFDAAAMAFLSSSVPMTQTGNTLTLNYTNLQPYAYEFVYLNFNMAQPPVIDMGDIITFTTQITPVEGDIYLADNTDVWDQMISNSFDPNDISVREGESITPDQTDNYLHYTIRFQNMGNANAQFVKILTQLDANLDVNTFEPIASSHSYAATVEGNNVEFSFDDIQLPGEQMDEPASHGFITYRIKPKTSVGLGDVMAAQANIYFDFNEAVPTNTVTTTVQNTMGVADFAADGFKIYPNPASGKVTLQLAYASVNAADVVIADVLGKTVISRKVNVSGAAADMDISALTGGIYFVTLTSEGKSVTKKLVVK